MLDCSDSALGGYSAALSELEYGNGGGLTKQKCSAACAASGGGDEGKAHEGGEHLQQQVPPCHGLFWFRGYLQ